MATALPYRSAGDRAAAEAFFDGRAASKAVWHDLARHAATWGPVEVTATKVRVCLTAQTRFCYTPKAYKDGGIVLRFLLPRAIASPRLARVDDQGRWSHRIDLHGPGLELDDELLGWLREAYEWDRSTIRDAKVKVSTARPRTAGRPTTRAGEGATMDWTCPRCGQQFARKGQAHSCDRRAVEELFAEFPKAIKVTQLVKAHLDTLGRVQMAATKTQVSFRGGRTRFAWVWVPRQSAGSGPKDPRVSFALRRKMESRRVETAVAPRGDLWVHHVPVTAAKHVDDELKAWLAESYETVGPGATA